MKREHLRVFLLAVCALGSLLWAYNSFIFQRGYSPVDLSATGSNWVASSVPAPSNDVDDSGPDTHPVIKVGEGVELSPATALERWEYFSVAPASARLPFYVDRGGAIQKIVLSTRIPRWTFDFVFGALAIVWMFAFAAVIVLRGKPSQRTHMLSLILILWAITNQLWSGNLYTPWAALSAACDLLNFALNGYSVYMMVRYAETFGAMTALRRVLRVVANLGGISIFVFALFIDGGIIFNNPTLNRFGNLAQSIAWVVSMFGTIACLIAAIVAAGRERDEAIWASVPMAIIAFFQGIIIGALTYNVPGVAFLSQATNVAFFVFPLGLTYASLARRVVDIGFAINRAVVYTTVSIVIVAAFVLGEWLLGKWIDETNATTGLYVNAALAVALGLSIRFVHSRIDKLLDTIFFRKRHEDEHAIRAFAHEAAYITDANVLLERTATILEQRADASFVHVIEGNGNDPALVALRAWRERVDLAHFAGTAIEGEWMYPMVARGHFLGALVLGQKRAGESYAPDEADAIQQLAHGVALALDGLKRGDDPRLVRIEAMLEALPQRIADAIAMPKVPGA